MPRFEFHVGKGAKKVRRARVTQSGSARWGWGELPRVVKTRVDAYVDALTAREGSNINVKGEAADNEMPT